MCKPYYESILTFLFDNQPLHLIWLQALQFVKKNCMILGIATEISVWDGVVVSPLERAYEKSTDKKEDDDMETEETNE